MRTIAAWVVLVGYWASIVLGGGESLAGRNWPHWRGPNGAGIAPTGDLPIEWGGNENMRWKVAIPGRGHATPIVWEDRVFLLTAVPADEKDDAEARREVQAWSRRVVKPKSTHKFDVLCVDRKSGRVLWQRTAREERPHEGHYRVRGTFASASAVTDGEHVYAYFGSRGLYCYDMKGNLKWQRDLGKLHMRMAFGEGSSPTVHDNVLIVNRDHERDSEILALDKRTGKTLWKKDRDEPSSWSTPLVVTQDGKPQVIVPATNAIRSYDPVTGETVWTCRWNSGNVIPSPVFGHGMVFLTTGHRRYSKYDFKAIRLGATGDLTDSKAVAWSLNKHTPYVPSPLLYGDELYLLGDKGFLSCYDARTGKPHYVRKRVRGSCSASPVGASDRIYIVSESGDVAVIKRGPTFEILATNEMGETFFASPAVAGNDLFLRSDRHLYCISKQVNTSQ